MALYAGIRRIATYLPPTVETNETMDARFVKKIGVKERHIAQESESSGDLAVGAGKKLFAQGDIRPDEIDFLILCTQYPDHFMPTTACWVQSQLGLPQTCGALDYNLGCSGYVYGLALAKGMLETGLAKNLLLITSSVYTKFANPEDMTVRPLFGDGATATLMTSCESETPFLHSFVFGTDGGRGDRLIVPAGGSRNMSRSTPLEFEEYERGNKRTNYDAFMDGTAITYFTLREVPQLVDAVLQKADLKREDLDYCVFHQANKFMLEYVRKKCQLMEVPFHNDIELIGNTVSGTIPFGIESILVNKSPTALKKVLLTGFGVGLSWAGCIADLSSMGGN